MTDREKAIVMAHTGICMLTGDKFQIFHKYVEDIMGRPIWTSDIGFLENEIKEKSKDDFIALCADEGGSEKLNRWIPVSEKLPSDGKYLVTRGDVIGRPMIGMRYFSKDLSKVDEFDFVDKKGISGWCEYDSEYGWYIDDKVIAWCELPEPYKAEESEKE
jgi:hypothetical protein